MIEPRISLARAAEIATQAALKGAQQPGAPAYLSKVNEGDWSADDWVIQAILDAYADGVAAASVQQQLVVGGTPTDAQRAEYRETFNIGGMTLVADPNIPPGELHAKDPNTGEILGKVTDIPYTPASPATRLDSANRMPRMYDAWKHRKSGRLYFVNQLANDHTSDPAKFPPTVVYTHVPTDQTWARPLDAFWEKFEYVGVKAASKPDANSGLDQKLKDMEDEALDLAAENLTGTTKLECKLALKSMIEEQSRQMKPLILALTKIWKWHGEFPNAHNAQGEVISYWQKYGTAGERDFMRRVAARAIKKENHPLPGPINPADPFQ